MYKYDTSIKIGANLVQVILPRFAEIPFPSADASCSPEMKWTVRLTQQSETRMATKQTNKCTVCIAAFCCCSAEWSFAASSLIFLSRTSLSASKTRTLLSACKTSLTCCSRYEKMSAYFWWYHKRSEFGVLFCSPGLPFLQTASNDQKLFLWHIQGSANLQTSTLQIHKVYSLKHWPAICSSISPAHAQYNLDSKCLSELD